MTREKSGGFTLVETIVVVLLIGIGMIVIFNMFLSQNRLYRSQSSELNITSSVRFALDDIDNYVRQATGTLSTYGSYTASAQTLILEVQSVNASNLLVVGTYDHIVYYMSGSNLHRVIIPDASSARSAGDRTIATNVSSLSFTLNNTDYAQVSEVTTAMTCTETFGGRSRAFSGSTKTRLRNF